MTSSPVGKGSNLGAIVVESSMAQLPIAGVTPNVQAMVPSNPEEIGFYIVECFDIMKAEND